MRLTGSLTEDQLRAGLTESNTAILSGGGDPKLREFLVTLDVNPTTAFVLHWIPEQSEDIFTILDGRRRALIIEMPRGTTGTPLRVEAIPFVSFRESIAKSSRRTRLQFAVALSPIEESSSPQESSR